MSNNKLRNYTDLVWKIISCNLRIIFANKFIWFLTGSVIFYLGLSVIYVFSNNVSRMEDLFGVFLFSGLLLVFYPAVFGIQNDMDARTIEILFGIPDYRYKVWLVRIILIFIMAFTILLFFTFLSSVLIVKFRILPVTLQIMVPVLFMGMLGFFLSTVIRNGNGTAVILIIIGILFMMFGDSALGRSQWNIFLNPYNIPYEMNETSWALVTFRNRIILLTGSVLFLLGALLNLQNREKYM